MKKTNAISELAVVFFLILVAALSHLVLVPVGLALLNSEWAVFSLVADHFRKGDFSAFPFQQPYAGLTLTALRALFVSLWEALSQTLGLRFGPLLQNAHIAGHMIFSYTITPVLMTLSSYFLLRSYCSKLAAIIVSLLCAFGFEYWVFHYGNDFYPFYFMLGCLLLGVRSKLENPFLELSPLGLFLAGILCGQAHYTTRATLLFIIPFLVPLKCLKWEWIKEQAVSIFGQTSWIDHFLTKLSLFFFCLFFYIEVFGRDLGEFFEKHLKVDSKPNLTLSTLLLAVVWTRKHYFVLHKTNLYRCIYLGLGFLLGSLPERLYWLSRGRLTSEVSFPSHSFSEAIHILGFIPGSLQTLVSGDYGLGRIFSTLLFLIGLFCLVKFSKKKNSLRVLLFVLALSVLAYCRVNTYMVDLAPPRYLFPIFPVLLVGVGKFWDWALSERKKAWILFAMVFTIGHTAHHLGTRTRTVKKYEQTKLIQTMWDLAKTFDETGVRIVLSDEFLETNAYSLMSKEKVLYWSTGRPWGPPKAFDLANNEKKVGLLLDSSYPISETGEVEIFGRKFVVYYLKSLKNRKLYVGTAVNR